MDWGVIGAASGIVSIIGLVLCYVTKFAKMETKVNLLWVLYVEDQMKKLIKQGDMKRSSEAETTDKGEQALSAGLKQKLRDLALKKRPKTLYAAHRLLMKEVGLTELNSNSLANPCPTCGTTYTIGELALLAAGYMVKMTKSHSNSPN